MLKRSNSVTATCAGCVVDKPVCAPRIRLCAQVSRFGSAGRYSRYKGCGAVGTTLLELTVVLAIVGVLLAISVPSFQSSLKIAHLSAATTQVRGAILSTRFQAIMQGCPYTIAFYQNNQNYQIQGQTPQNNPPTCTANTAVTIPWSTSGDVTLSASTTLQFAPNGIVTLVSGGSTPCPTGTVACLILSNGTPTTNTLFISGAGNVTVTSP